MKEIRVRYKNQVFITIVDEEDYDLRTLTLRIQRSPSGKIYIRSSDKMLHAIILVRMIGRSLGSGEYPDHKDRNALNNTRSNIRLSSNSQNTANNTGRLREYPHGVDKPSLRFRARIRVNGIQELLGYFDTSEEAHSSFKHRHAEVYGEFSPYFQGEK